MRFELSDEHGLVKESVREFLRKEAPLENTRTWMDESDAGYAPPLYRKLAELGYLALWLPEKEGGSGMGAIGLAVVLHEMGRVALPGPALDRMLALEQIRRCSGALGTKWRDALIAGDAHIVSAHAENAAGGVGRVLTTRCEDGHVRGEKRYVPFAADADALLVTTRDGLALVARPEAGWNVTATPTFDHAQRFSTVVFDSPGELLLEGVAAEEAAATSAHFAALAAAAWLLGGMERAFEITLDYLKEREAFGAPLGSFQGLQHRAADMLLRVESTRACVYRAAWTFDHDPEHAPLLSATAKVYAGRAAREVCGEAIQMHGGVGFTWEYDPHVFFKRTKTLEQFYGTTREQLDRVLEAHGI
ncbi:MAG: acyl-CoA/acyl-ACP dehydrogenase [Myxococcales bacterium]|nr:acyl-CoA/acyl-ACP dehydrogenase [Myxococcales bacterium]